MWTRFWDMSSGGGRKVRDYRFILIEAPEPEARAVFMERFGRDPDNVTCRCCGADYVVDTFEHFEEFERQKAGLYIAFDATEVLVVPASELAKAVP